MEAEAPTVRVGATPTELTAPPPPQLLQGFLQAGCPSCRPTNSVKALKARWLPEVTEKINNAHSMYSSLLFNNREPLHVRSAFISQELQSQASCVCWRLHCGPSANLFQIPLTNTCPLCNVWSAANCSQVNGYKKHGSDLVSTIYDTAGKNMAAWGQGQLDNKNITRL